MSDQIIRQRQGLYAVFSSITDTWILYDATRGALLDYYAEKAAEQARSSVERIIAAVDRNPREAYYQFTMTFEEANAKSVEHEGLDLSDRAPEGKT